jgi:HEPN domain-containing protein
MRNAKTNNTVSAGALLNDARQYHAAADALFESKIYLSRPINALYFHTVELALKAYLRAHGGDPWGHKIGKLYNECRASGLKITSDDRFGLGNIVSLLEKGNEDMAFRYFTLKSGSEPDLRWTREVVGQLMQAVEAFVQPDGPVAPGRIAKLTMVIGMPVDKNV